MALYESSFVFVAILLCLCKVITYAQLTSDFYSTTCPNALSTIQTGVRASVQAEARMGASLLRTRTGLRFVRFWFLLAATSSVQGCVIGEYDQGCDASVLLDDTATFTGEKTAAPNNNSLRGYDVIDSIKASVEALCPGVVSCDDILAVAARDSVAALGGPTWTVLLGRRDSTTASLSAANSNLPAPSFSSTQLSASFANQGLSLAEMVAISGGHTIGQAQCLNFRQHIYNDTDIDSTYAASLRTNCPISGGDENLAPLDVSTATSFDNAYYTNLLSNRSLLHYDQELFGGSVTDAQVRSYSASSSTFFTDFANAMVKMGNISPLTGTNGQIRTNCRRVN